MQSFLGQRQQLHEKKNDFRARHVPAALIDRSILVTGHY
jgi:hypothetical protein